MNRLAFCPSRRKTRGGILPLGRNELSSKHREMIEGPEAFKRFRDALKSALSVPKGSLPARTKKRAKRKPKTNAFLFAVVLLPP
jgi:hypothetical protein